MTPLDLLRTVGPMLLALAAAFAFDSQSAKRRLLPPGFAVPWRRALALGLLAGMLWLGVFAPLGLFGLEIEHDVAGMTVPRLFLLHALLTATLLAWFLLGFLGTGRPREAVSAADPLAPEAPPSPGLLRVFAAQFGFRAPRPAYELALGLVLGVAAWAAVLGAMLVVGAVVFAVGGESALPKAPPALVPWIVALPVGVRIAVSVSAGVVEEAFFRGFLQPRAGILFSTLCFTLAHAAYAQPLLLVAVTLLSLVYASLVRWRQNVLVAVAAHALFDTVQLLVVIPAALELLGRQARPAAALLALG